MKNKVKHVKAKTPILPFCCSSIFLYFCFVPPTPGPPGAAPSPVPHPLFAAFCDEEEVTRRQEAMAQDSQSKQEMYSEQRSMMRHSQTSRTQESHQFSQVSAEAQEWQSMVKSEARKSAVSYATTSHFDMVSFPSFF